MHSAIQSRSALLQAFCRRGTALLVAMSLGTALMSVGSGAQTQETRAAFHPQKGFRAKLASSPGLSIATYQMPEGRILVYLPDDLHAAQTIISTMRLQPKGKNESERAINLTTLAAYHFLWGTQVQTAQETPLTWILPGAETTDADKLTLADALDHPLAQVEIPVAVPLPPLPVDTGGAAVIQTTAGSLRASKIALPRRGVVGRPLVLQAPVGVEALTYQVLVGDKPARLLAASSRSLIVESPADVLGKTTLQVKKDYQVMAESAFQNDRASHRTNPWPYVIGAGVVLGIMTALAIKSFNDHFADGLRNSFNNFYF